MPILIELAFQTKDSHHLNKKMYVKRNGADAASAAPGFYQVTPQLSFGYSLDSAHHRCGGSRDPSFSLLHTVRTGKIRSWGVTRQLRPEAPAGRHIWRLALVPTWAPLWVLMAGAPPARPFHTTRFPHSVMASRQRNFH